VAPRRSQCSNWPMQLPSVRCLRRIRRTRMRATELARTRCCQSRVSASRGSIVRRSRVTSVAGWRSPYGLWNHRRRRRRRRQRAPRLQLRRRSSNPLRAGTRWSKSAKCPGRVGLNSAEDPERFAQGPVGHCQSVVLSADERHSCRWSLPFSSRLRRRRRLLSPRLNGWPRPRFG